MQAIREKLHDMSEMRKAKAEAKAEEKVEKDIAKARMGIAHEVRMAKEAEAEMDLHAAKAGELLQKERGMHAPESQNRPNASNS
ncbi:late embryogenesis abundant protein 6-like [Durio zibethinus]|uniref:Late embryogenesis abundant protein 6-like n=1 Tax=Durio zibethinus TaxID=66656 RepID=A0A6P5YXU3_DURZI|nr:late embryogenesis abundant protein 6-like [Durio zibethinus]